MSKPDHFTVDLKMRHPAKTTYDVRAEDGTHARIHRTESMDDSTVPTVWKVDIPDLPDGVEAPAIPDGSSLVEATRILFEFLKANREPTVADLEAAITRLREGAPAAIRALLGVL